jgi:glucose/arabinose dehydrogenase
MPHPTTFVRAWLIIAAAAIGLSAMSCDDDGDVDSRVPTPARSATATDRTQEPGPTSSAGPATAVATPPPTQAIVPEGYRAVQAFANANFPRMIALVPIPGDETHAGVATQQDGIVYRISITDASEPATVMLDVSEQLIDSPGNEEGLLGLAFSPDFQQDRGMYVAYSAGGPRRNTVARYAVPGNAADPASGRVILEVEDFASNHNGGALAFGPDGYLYIALGDGGGAGDPQSNGQSLDTLLGKILRLDVSGDTYSVPDDNPFVGSGRGEIWAYGLRNPWRMTVDRETGALWAGDVGQGSWEEVDSIERGGNYGWSTMEGFDCFRGDGCDQTGLIAPRAVYATHQGNTCAITGGYVYRGARLPELVGWYIYADYCSGHVWGVNTADTSEPVLLMDTDLAISSFAEDPAGEVYLVTFNEAIYGIERAAP